MPDSRNVHRGIKVALALAILAAVVALWASGAHESISPAAIRTTLLESGPWGPLAFVLAFACLQPLGVAAHVFVLGATLVWEPWVAFGLSLGGALIAGCVSFFGARYMGRQWVQQRLPPRLRGYDQRLANDGFRTVLVLRLIFFTFGPMQLMFGMSRLRFVPFILGSALGLAPMIALETWLGGNLIDWLTTWLTSP